MYQTSTNVYRTKPSLIPPRAIAERLSKAHSLPYNITTITAGTMPYTLTILMCTLATTLCLMNYPYITSKVATNKVANVANSSREHSESIYS